MNRSVESANSIGEFSPFIENRYYRGDAYLPAIGALREYQLETVQAGLLPLSRYSGGALGLRRTWAHIRESSSEIYVIWFPLVGDVWVTQDLVHNTHCEVGSFVVTCGDRPFHVRASSNGEQGCRQLHAIVPSHIMRSQLPNIDRYCGLAFSAQRGAGMIGAEILGSLISESEGISKECIHNLGLSGLDAICDAVRRATENEPSIVDTRKANAERVLRLIDQHFPTQGLTAERVASACNISRRYLHYLLEESNTSFGEYLWEGRLQQARTWLFDPEFRHFNIVDIAYMCGFRSASHFSNAYRQRFGMPPSSARNESPVSGDGAIEPTNATVQ